MKLTPQMLIQVAVACGLYRSDSSAFEAVRSKVHQREADARESEAVRRLETVRNRIGTTNEQLAAAIAASEQAEADHFTSLGGDSESAIEAARHKVLAAQQKVGLLRTEVESLKSIHAEARAAFGQYVEAELPRLYADIVSEAQAKQAAAVEAIQTLIESTNLMEQLKALADATEQCVIAGSDAHALRIACTDLGMSELFGRKLPPNHVSMRSPAFSDLSSEQRLFAQVRA